MESGRMQVATAAALRGRATGVLFFSGFGALWLILGLAGRQSLSVATVIGLAAGLGVLVAAALTLSRRAAGLPQSPVDPGMQRRDDRAFAWINAIQWVAIFLIAFVLGQMHLDAFIPAAVTVVVGLHFFPLARVFRYPQHHVTGAALVAWGLGCLALVPRDVLQSTTAFGTGAILWASAALTLVRGFRALTPAAGPAAR